MRRWRLTSAAVVDSAADQRSGVFTCWRGNAAGLGGWTLVTRLSLATLQATGVAFFGLYASIGALATTLALSAVVSCIGIGFQRGTHTRWQLVANDASGAPTLVDMGASFAITTGGVLTLFIAAAPNASSVWVRVRGDGHRLRAGGDRRPAGDEPVPGAAVFHEQWRYRRRRRFRLRRRPPRDRSLIRPLAGVRPERRACVPRTFPTLKGLSP
jgi:hypothetical protein